jgi:hypothetical protein
MKLETSPYCPAAFCMADEAHCRGSYLFPSDDKKMMTCVGPPSDLVFHMCMGSAPEGYYPDAEHEFENLNDIGVMYPTNGHCHQMHRVQAGDSCAALQERYGMTWHQFHGWNPSLGDDCQWLVIGKGYCVSKRSHRNFIA